MTEMSNDENAGAYRRPSGDTGFGKPTLLPTNEFHVINVATSFWPVATNEDLVRICRAHGNAPLEVIPHLLRRILSDDTAMHALQNENARIPDAIALAFQYGGIDGDHHKAWVIDQMIRILAGDGYARLVAEANDGEDGPNTYTWNEGIVP